MTIHSQNPNTARRAGLQNIVPLPAPYKPADTLEEALAVDADKPHDAPGFAVLTDRELREGGLAAVRAYVPTKRARKSKAAERQKKKREADAKVGRIPFSASVPQDSAPHLREISRRLVAGDLPVAAVEALASQAAPTPTPPDRLGERCRAILAAGGLRARLLRWALS